MVMSGVEDAAAAADFLFSDNEEDDAVDGHVNAAAGDEEMVADSSDEGAASGGLDIDADPGMLDLQPEPSTLMREGEILVNKDLSSRV